MALEQWELDEVARELDQAVLSTARYLVEKGLKRTSQPARPQPQPARPRPQPQRAAASSELARSNEWYAERQRAAREWETQRAAYLRRQRLEELDPVLRAADEEIASRNADQNLMVAEQLKAAGKPIPKALLNSIRNDLDFAQGNPAAGRKETATRE